MARSALAGDQSELEVEVPLEGRIYKIVAVPLKDEDGEIRRGLALTQGITKLKQTQSELEKLNRKLQALSSTDSLLGMASPTDVSLTECLSRSGCAAPASSSR
jgi:hypothetical protein